MAAGTRQPSATAQPVSAAARRRDPKPTAGPAPYFRARNVPGTRGGVPLPCPGLEPVLMSLIDAYFGTIQVKT
jgi:hypothetical protein